MIHGSTFFDQQISVTMAVQQMLNSVCCLVEYSNGTFHMLNIVEHDFLIKRSVLQWMFNKCLTVYLALLNVQRGHSIC